MVIFDPLFGFWPRPVSLPFLLVPLSIQMTSLTYICPKQIYVLKDIQTKQSFFLEALLQIVSMVS